MLCDICGARETTIHKTAADYNVPAVVPKNIPVRHYCTACFERMFHQKPLGDYSEEEKETPTPSSF